ncbi:TetR/AcrR family transcriptional regulator [Kutzneria viridogrisea]|nr:TetR/AcrR family transcriptional regulator [Kutzneria albida]MBA8925279.1 AcrR family transcriptional regulator [Kutzneria viridogrisea]
MPTSTWHNLEVERRERVLDAAMAEFGAHGYSAGSLNVIARNAGVAKGSLFQYFTDKFDFYAHVTEHVAAQVRAAMQPWLVLPAGRPFAEFLLDGVMAWIDYFGSHPVQRGVTAATMLEMDPTVRAAVRTPVHRMYGEGLRPLLEQARQVGELPADTDLEIVLAMLVMVLPQLALAPFEPGLDPVIPLYGKTSAELRAPVRRLLGATLRGDPRWSTTTSS